jgi:hypothetical protein
MNNLGEMVKDLDFFEHQSLLRYQREPGYKTLTGGIVSLLLILIFVGLFANLVIDTFNNSIITDGTNVSYDSDPTYYELKANP